MDNLNVLKKFFGYASFREGQEELIKNILAGRDTLGVMPTGAGKSICYQLPAIQFDGITLVISPLISLMKDQVHALTQAGIPAAFINSSLSQAQFAKAMQNAADYQYKIIYIAPERLLTDEFIRFSNHVKIAMVTIDEAHCISQWGQDFRPSYLKITRFIDELVQRPVVTAFTATATSEVRADIVDMLGLCNPHILTTGFDRVNLHFSVAKPNDKMTALKDYISNNRTKSGIIYCLTRKTVEEVCDSLLRAGFAASRYHAGLSEKERMHNQDAFIFDRCNIMVATNAFGMGIDKSNVSYVIHYNMPKNMESYYQEAGRAGRDGEAADCILLYSGQDVVTNQYMIENSSDNEELDQITQIIIKKRNHELLKIMTFYCHTNNCLREYILNYFGDKAPNYCGNCSNCNTCFEEADVTEDAKKILSCIRRSGERFGIKMIVDILRGSKNQKILSNRMDKLTTYGLMNTVAESKIRDIINHLVLSGCLEITNSEYPVIKVTRNGLEFVRGADSLRMKVQKNYRDIEPLEEAKFIESRSTMDKKTGNGQRKDRSKRVISNNAKLAKEKLAEKNINVNEELFERLRLLRNKLALKQRVPAYIVFSDATLKQMCMHMPADEEEFLEVNGVGQAKLEKYGEEFLSEIKAYNER